MGNTVKRGTDQLAMHASFDSRSDGFGHHSIISAETLRKTPKPAVPSAPNGWRALQVPAARMPPHSNTDPRNFSDSLPFIKSCTKMQLLYIYTVF